MPNSSAPPRGCLTRLGLAPKLVLVSLVMMVLAVTAVESWTLREARSALAEAAHRQLATNVTLLEEMLYPLGTGWSLQNGTLSLGGHPVNGREDIVDALRRTGGGAASLFAGDMRVASNVIATNGHRATGTRLAPGPVHDAIFLRGESYQGIAQILGRPHLAIYEPLRDAGGKVVGILFVGMPLVGTLRADYAADPNGDPWHHHPGRGGRTGELAGPPPGATSACPAWRWRHVPWPQEIWRHRCRGPPGVTSSAISPAP